MQYLKLYSRTLTISTLWPASRAPFANSFAKISEFPPTRGVEEITITLNNDAEIEGSAIMNEGINILIDLNGHKISGNVVNNGSLRIKDSVGVLDEKNCGTITGSGTLELLQ